MADAKKPKTKLYRLIGRQHSGFDEDGNIKDYKTGDKVPLTDTQYEAFSDKFEQLNRSDEDEGQGDPELTAELPATKVGAAPDTVKTDQKAPATGAGAAQNSTAKKTVA